MLGNWSFGDYFKREAIEWAWELVIERWKFPPQRLNATVYQPGPGEPSEFDQEAHDHWARLFQKAGLDPAVQIVNGNKKDNFWMMGDTGPCGPCSELHIDLTPAGDTRGALVNAGDPRCIEIWNLVFIQFNANADGTFSPLPQRHADTGLGFERATAIIQGTKSLTDFSGTISNYDTDIFRPIFDEIEKLSGKRYGATLPKAGSTGETDQKKIDVAFRVVADHIRTLSFAIADGIQPSNEGRGYVLRRILRRAVRYGRTLGFHEPFFYKLVDVLVGTMGDGFPELRAKQQLIRDTIRREEDSFNRTLDKGIDLFEREVSRLGSTGGPPVDGGGSPASSSSHYHRRNLPHFERPWAIYHITWTTQDRREVSPPERQIVLDSILHWHERRYELFAACVMPDHVHMLIQPLVKEQDDAGNAVFFPLSEILHTIKSFTAHEINKRAGRSGALWNQESFDRYIRTDRDLEEKFRYIVGNPWSSGVAKEEEDYAFVWAGESRGSGEEGRRAADLNRPAACAPRISGAFAFRLYDEQGFPLDLTELMARERGLSVDTEEFERLMDAQRSRARAAQKKTVVSLADGLTKRTRTGFEGFEATRTNAHVLEHLLLDGRTALVLDKTVCYAAMGGQVGDTGVISVGADAWRIVDTQKSGNTFLHILESEDTPETEIIAEVAIDVPRRRAIERHHTVTHLLHWALHEVVSREAVQKGSYVGPEKLTFDFSSAALTHQQVRDVEKLVNERIAEDAAVSWREVSYVEAKKRADIQQFFGDKYGDMVRVVQIGGTPNELNGYSMELCGGTHVRATGEIKSFKIVSESAIAAGIRRIEAVAGDEVLNWAKHEAARQQETFQMLSRKKQGIAALPDDPANDDASSVVAAVEARAAHLKKLESEVHEWEKQHAKAAEAELRSRGSIIANELAAAHAGSGSCIAEVPDADGALLQAVADALKTKLQVPIVLAGSRNGRVDLVATVPKDLTSKVRANEIIQQIAPIVGGKGGGRPDNARGAGTNPSAIADALERAREEISRRSDG
jgi:alanyl-tRNA synthetase/REP element-mobilizing transposase RayT